MARTSVDYIARQKEILGLEMRPLVEDAIVGGQITAIDASDIPPSAFQLAKNVVVRYNRTSRRPGIANIVAVTADVNTVLRFLSFKTKAGTPYTIRVTPSTAHRLNGDNTWSALAIAAGLHGTATDQMQMVDVLDTIVLSNNGVDVLQKVDPAALTIGALGNAPAYRYICGFYNRAVGAALRNVNEVQIGWSGDGAITEWNSAVDQTAGLTPLLDSPADVTDFITGLAAFTSVMVVARQRSIWLANKQAIPTNPFYFYSAIPGIGCDCPYSFKKCGSRVAWMDTRTKAVWAWIPGTQPERISIPIENQIIASVNDPSTVFGAYSATWDEYTIFIPPVGSSTIQAWTFSFSQKAWTYAEYQIVSSVDDVDQISATPISALTGPISGLTGPIVDLSAITTKLVRNFGHTDGTIANEDATLDTDQGTQFEANITSKSFRLPVTDLYVAKIVLEYQCSSAPVGSQMILEYSKSGGAKNDWITAKTITPTVFNVPVNLILRRMVKTRRYAWRLRMPTTGQYDLLHYEVHTYLSGDSRGD